jgi:hypothetical protein
MNARIFQVIASAGVAFLLAGCATPARYDYTNHRQHPPRSILILPPLNESASVEGPYSFLSTVSHPVAERGYYVFPVAVVDRFFKENGMPTAGEMHQVSLEKVLEVTGADAVLFVTLEEYGSKYQLINSATIVRVRAQLVDTRTGLLLWEGKAAAEQGSGGSGNLLGDIIAAAITQAINSGTDAARGVCRIANATLFYTKDHGLLVGPYHPEYGKD